MAYQTPTYNYETARSALTQNKGFEDVARNYGRFMSQERFRRSNEDMQQDFTRKFPKVGTAFNRRGMWDSGLRREGQQQFVGDYNRNQGRLQFDQAQEATRTDMDQARSDALYQQGLLQLLEQLNAGRASGFDPFAAVR
jgi:hypothetical protein